jgi:hypothetical protein
MAITLARNAGDYGEGTDVDFSHIVKVYCFDGEQPNGLLVFQGYISSYTPIYKDNNVQIVLLSYGEELNNYISEAGETLSIDNSPIYFPLTFGNYGSPDNTRSVAQTLTAPADEIWGRIELCTIAFNPANHIPLTLDIYAWDTDIATSIDGAILGTATSITGNSWVTSNTNFVFVSPIPVTNGTVYVAHLHTTNEYYPGSDKYVAEVAHGYTAHTYAGGTMYFGLNAAPLTWVDSTWDMSFAVYTFSGNTTATFNSQDPSNILKAILDDYHNRGGTIYYDDDSIDLTGTTVSYTFNTNTVLECINKCLELAPVGWYWYIDYSTNLLHFHAKNNIPDHTFSLEKDLADAQFEKRIEDIVNTIYFTGGDTGGGVSFYEKYTMPGSITKYGIKAQKYVDQRVTLSTTAETISNSILEAKSEPELRVTLEIIDSNNNKGLGYDIESVQVGDVVAVRNVNQQVGLSTWDVARWDSDYWDYNIYNLSSLQMQVQKVDYKKDVLIVTASTLPADVSKRIEDINRNLEVLQTLNNPTTPG